MISATVDESTQRDPVAVALARFADCRPRVEERDATLARSLHELPEEDDLASPRKRAALGQQRLSISAHKIALGHASVACRLAAKKLDALVPWRGFLLAVKPDVEKLLEEWEALPVIERNRTERHGAMLRECLRVIDLGPSNDAGEGAGEVMPQLLHQRLMRARGLSSYPSDGLFGGYGGLLTLEARLAERTGTLNMALLHLEVELAKDIDWLAPSTSVA